MPSIVCTRPSFDSKDNSELKALYDAYVPDFIAGYKIDIAHKNPDPPK